MNPWYNGGMQKIATKVFIAASIIFGVLGIVVVLTLPGENDKNDSPNIFLFKLLLITGFVVLTSFALSVAGKYLNNKK
jgi:hypothetical protein